MTNRSKSRNKYIFGPVPSKRLGLSLGIDLTPTKTCSFDCRYCQLIPTRVLTAQRQAFCDPEEVLTELREVMSEIERPDWITFSGTGEPTLHSDIGLMIRAIKAACDLPVCIITNSSLLWREDVRADLAAADHILPTLVTTRSDTFAFLHRPTLEIGVEHVLDGIRLLSRDFKGTIEIEIFVCPGINDSEVEISGLRSYIDSLPRPHAIYLNTAVRPHVDSGIKTAGREQLSEYISRLNLPLNVSTVFDPGDPPRSNLRNQPVSEDDIYKLLLRHPCRIDQISAALGISEEKALPLLTAMLENGLARPDEIGCWSVILSP